MSINTKKVWEIKLASGDVITVTTNPRMPCGRTSYNYYFAGSVSYTNSDMLSGCQGGTAKEGMASLLSFLTAFAESRRHGKPSSDNWTLFPDSLAEWAMANDDEFTMHAMEIDPDLQ